MRRLLLLLFLLLASLPAAAQSPFSPGFSSGFGTGAAVAFPPGCTATTCTGSALPSGFLTVNGDQFVSGGNVTVRLACTTFTGAPNDGTMTAIRAGGFNCLRIQWRDRYLTAASPVPGTCGTLAQIQTCVSNAQAAGLPVILSHQGNEVPTGTCVGRQQNGLWFDSLGASGNDDGCGGGHNVTYAIFKTNTVNLLQAFVGNSAVIGYEFHHEPLVNGAFTGQCSTTPNICFPSGNPPVNWGGGGDTDIQAACQDVGKAVFAVNASVILFCPGPINNSTTLFNGATRGSTNPHGDLTLVPTRPVATTGLPPTKVAYSVDEFPNSVSGYTGASSGAAAITAYNTSWGFLLQNHSAAVMLMSLGCSCDGTNGASSADNAWATTIAQYANGTASGGPTWPTSSQPQSTVWQAWGYLGTQNPNGTLLSNLSTLNVSQDTYWSTLLYAGGGGGGGPPPTLLTTWNPGDLVAIGLSGNNLIATVTSPSVFINGDCNCGFTDSHGNFWSVDGEANAYVTPPGGSLTPLGDINEIAFNTNKMALWNDTAYIQDFRDLTWHTIDPNTFAFSGSVAAPATGGSAVRTTTSKSTGKVCWEVTATTISNNWRVGLANATYSLSGSAGLGTDINGIAFDPNYAGGNQATGYNGAFPNTGSTLSTNGEVIAQCADFGAQLLWSTDSSMRSASGAGAWNNSNTCNPTVAACGISFSGLTGALFITFNSPEISVATINTGALASIAMPSGFSTWDTAVAGRGPMILILGANDNHPSPLLRLASLGRQ